MSVSNSKTKWLKTCYNRAGMGKEIKIAAFDVETNGLGGELLMATYMVEGTKPYALYGSACIPDLLDIMSNYSGHIWYAHNAQYDWRYFLEIFRDNPSRVRFTLRNDNSIYQVKYEHDNGNTITMRDSFALWGHSLADLARNFCPEFPKLDVDIAHFDIRNPLHVSYALRDVEILCVGLRRLNDAIVQNYNVNISGTAASTAMRAWERMLGKEEKYFNPEAYEKFIRSAYFGGFVFLTNRDAHKNATTYDINSSYPFQMKTHGVPYGRISNVRTLQNDVPGIYEVTVSTPKDLRVPILPAREGKNSGPIWPSGTFRTVVTSIELTFALSHGYRLHEVHKGIVFEKLIFPFERFVAKAETIRARHKGTVFEIVAKLMQNSLYGKFGSRRERKKVINADEVEPGSGDCVPLDEFGAFYVKTETADDMMTLPQWAVWITANARLHLLRTIYDEVGVQNVIYGDTDSITVRDNSNIRDVGKSYGQWKMEKVWEVFRAIAPKVYAGRIDGEWKGACKGIPAKRARGASDIYRDIFENDVTSVNLDYLPSFMVTMAKGEQGVKHVKRSSTDIKNSKNWTLEGTDVLPRPVGEAA